MVHFIGCRRVGGREPAKLIFDPDPTQYLARLLVTRIWHSAGNKKPHQVFSLSLFEWLICQIFWASVLKFSAAQGSVRHRTKHQIPQFTNDKRAAAPKASISMLQRYAAAIHRCRRLQGLQVQSASAARRSAQRGAPAHSIDGVVLEESDLKA